MKVLFSEEQKSWNDLHDKRMAIVRNKYGIPNVSNVIKNHSRRTLNILKDPEVEGLAVQWYLFDSHTVNNTVQHSICICGGLLGIFRNRYINCSKIVNGDNFDSFYSVHNDDERTIRYNKFVEPIIDDELFGKVLTLLRILLPFRQYLLIFASSRARISSVWVETERLLHCLEELQTNDLFLTYERKKQVI